MLIQKLTRQASTDFLARVRVGRLACAQGAQPYVVPFDFAYDNGCIYSFSSVGKKIDWMHSNPLVCVQADEVLSAAGWTSVVAYGRYDELPDTDQMHSTREFAWSLLQQRAQWWEPGAVKPAVDAASSIVIPVFYRICILAISGRQATVETKASSGDGHEMTEPVKKSWLQRLRSG